MTFSYIQRYLGPRLIQERYVSGIFSFITLDILRYICVSFGTLTHIQNPWLILPYSETLTYLSSFRHYSKVIYLYSEPYLNKFRYSWNSDLLRHAMFHAYSGIFTKLDISKHIFPHCDSDPGITGSSNVKQQLLLKLGPSFKSLVRSIWNIFLFLFQKEAFKKKFIVF